MHKHLLISLALSVSEWRHWKEGIMWKILLKLLILALGMSCVSCLRCYMCDSRSDIDCHVVGQTTRQINCIDMRVPAPLECLEMQFTENCK